MLRVNDKEGHSRTNSSEKRSGNTPPRAYKLGLNPQSSSYLPHPLDLCKLHHGEPIPWTNLGLLVRRRRVPMFHEINVFLQVEQSGSSGGVTPLGWQGCTRAFYRRWRAFGFCCCSCYCYFLFSCCFVENGLGEKLFLYVLVPKNLNYVFLIHGQKLRTDWHEMDGAPPRKIWRHLRLLTECFKKKLVISVVVGQCVVLTNCDDIYTSQVVTR